MRTVYLAIALPGPLLAAIAPAEPLETLEITNVFDRHDLPENHQKYAMPPFRGYSPYQPPRYDSRPYYGYGAIQPYRRPQYIPRPYRKPPARSNCGGGISNSIVERLENTLRSIDQSRFGIEQTLQQARRTRFSFLQFPRILLETARETTQMVREISTTFASIQSSCPSVNFMKLDEEDSSESDTSDASDSGNGASHSTELKVRLVSTLANLKKSVKSLESAIAQLFESPFKAFSNIEEIFTDLRDSIGSAITALVGDHDSDQDDNDQSDDSTTTDGFAGFSAVTDSATSSEPSSTGGFGEFPPLTDGGATSASVQPESSTDYSVPSPTVAPARSLANPGSAITTAAGPRSDHAGWTRLFTFTAEDYLTFTNEEVLTMDKDVVTRMFTFTASDVYRFTDTSVFNDQNAGPSPTGLL